MLKLESLAVGDLTDVDLTLAPGEVVCLSGPSGSGKTRLLRALADIEPHRGEVWLGEAAQSATPAHVWRRQVMLVPAESHWWVDTVGEHFQQPPPEQDLAALGLEQAVMGWQVARLSSGEKQRLALLRAVERQPSALLLDEPTANLDQDNIRRAEHWLTALARERGWPLLWVAHDPGQIARVADRHLYIQNHQLRNAGEISWT